MRGQGPHRPRQDCWTGTGFSERSLLSFQGDWLPRDTSGYAGTRVSRVPSIWNWELWLQPQCRCRVYSGFILATREAGSLVPSLGGALLVRVKLPDEVSLVDLPHLVPRDLLHQQQL